LDMVVENEAQLADADESNWHLMVSLRYAVAYIREHNPGVTSRAWYRDCCKAAGVHPDTMTVIRDGNRPVTDEESPEDFLRRPRQENFKSVSTHGEEEEK